jgi:RNA polymerase sigma-70 factor (ECF subfamily)
MSGEPRRRDADVRRAAPANVADGSAPAADGPGAVADRVVSAVYAEYGPMLHRYCLRLLGDTQMAQDAVQEVMLRVWRHPEALATSRGPARPWLLTVARNVVVDSARARRVRPMEVPLEPGTALPAEAISDDEIDRVVESWQIAEGLRQLSAAHRDVLVQMFYLDRTVQEAARVLGIPPGTVKSRAYYALRALRQALRDSGVTP